MPALTPAPADSPVVAVVPAGAARLAADQLADLARKNETGDRGLIAPLSVAGHALHRAGWADAGDRLDAARDYDDEHEDVEGVTLYAFPVELADALLQARGWTIEDVPGGNAYVKPGATLRADGGAHGRDYLWHREEALRLALIAEALEVQG